MNKYRAKKKPCMYGHPHDSGREAVRCNELHILQRGGIITGLSVHPKTKFVIDGVPVKLGNGACAGYTADFSYFEKGHEIWEDVKGFIVRDFPLRAALFQCLNPHIELRVTK